MKSINPVMRFLFFTSGANSFAFGLIVPFIAVFASQNIKGGDIQVASIAAGISPFIQGFTNLLGGKLLDHSLKKNKLLPFHFLIIRQLGSAAYFFAMAFAIFPWHLYALQAIYGAMSGLMLPAGNLIQTKYMDKDKEGWQWGISIAIFNVCYGIGGLLAGPLIAHFGFQVLFFTGAFFYLIASAGAWQTLQVSKRIKIDP